MSFTKVVVRGFLDESSIIYPFTGRALGGSPNPATLISITAGTISGSNLPISVIAAGNTIGATFWWVIVPVAEGTPSATQIEAGQNAAGGAPTQAGSEPYSGSFSEAVTLPDGDFKLCGTINNGAQGNVVASNTITVGAAGAFDPASLFSNGTRGGFWYDPQDFAGMHTTTNPDVQPTAAGQSIAELVDKGNYGFSQFRTSGNATLQQDGDNWYIDVVTGGSNTEGFWGDAAGYGGANMTDAAYFVAAKTGDTAFIFMATDNQSNYDGVAQDTQTTLVSSNPPFGSPTYWEAATQITTVNRDTLHAAWSKGTGAGNGTVPNMRGLTFNNGQILNVTRYPGGSSFDWNLRLYSAILIENPTAQETSDIISYMQGLMS